jgi:hypothetical protein
LFESAIDGKITIRLDAGEREVLGQLFDQMAQLLQELGAQETNDPLEIMLGMNGSTQISDDPALARLFPDGYTNDEHASADFRRFTEQDLRQQKIAALSDVRDTLENKQDPTSVNSQQAQSWLKAINDLRIALSIRLEINEESFETFEMLPDEDPQKSVYAVYFWLGWLQENLLGLLL